MRIYHAEKMAQKTLDSVLQCSSRSTVVSPQTSIESTNEGESSSDDNPEDTPVAKLKLCKTLQELALQVLSSEMISEIFPLVCKVLIHALVLPMSTSDCERCFSTMK